MKKFAICLAFIVSFLYLFGCGSGGDNGSSGSVASTPDQVPTGNNDVLQNFITSITPITSKSVNALTGDLIQAKASAGNRIKLVISPQSLNGNTIITVGSVDNPPAPPIGLNFVGPTFDFGPDGTTFNKSSTVEISFTEKDLQAAGIESKSTLKLYAFNKATKQWSEEKIKFIDTANNIVVGEVNHFSFYSLVGLSGISPKDLGTPQPGDLLFKLTTYDGGKSSGWVPGHVIIYTGEKPWNGKGLATDFVKFFGKYNVVESVIGVGVRYAYCDIPNVEESCNISAKPEGDSIYMGARQPKNFTLTSEQRIKIVEYVESKIGKPYLDLGVNYGITFGNNVKGPDCFNCVGLAEAAYEFAGVNDGLGILPNDGFELITPARVYAETIPAGGKYAGPIIRWATLTPNYGTSKTTILSQVAVLHPYGLDYINSVVYEFDDGYTNPNINFNDKGLNGDLQAGDGIYSTSARMGEYPAAIAGFNFIVTDNFGRSVRIRKEFTYLPNPLFTEVN